MTNSNSSNKVASTDDSFDVSADQTIFQCLTATPAESFFLFAGAGSGKTRSLVAALNSVGEAKRKELNLHGQRVGVITYTNKARDEIVSRLGFDPLFEVSTIHSFAWSLINGLNHDIRNWLKSHLQEKIADLKKKEANGRPGTKASEDRIKSIAVTAERIDKLDHVKRFTYNPDGENTEEEDLSHSEVINITASFLTEKTLMQRLIAGRFPILLIDESQDTSKHLMDALLHVQQALPNMFALGVIGDTMQRIYLDGKSDLGLDLPVDWKRPVKVMNHRSCTRVVELINKIRSTVDDQQQRSRSDKPEGFTRFFILPSATENKTEAERKIYSQMAKITGDAKWLEPETSVKTLALEHHMAAQRLGFIEMWEPLDKAPKLKTAMRKGELPGLRFFFHQVLPLLAAYEAQDRFAVASIVRKYSPLIDKSTLAGLGARQLGQFDIIIKAVDELATLCCGDKEPSFMEVLENINLTGLFDIPESLKPFRQTDAGDGKEDKTDELIAWRKFLETPFRQIEPYSRYVSGKSQFDTHQGVKGLQFERVCVIIDDQEARGFTFSYDKLFGAKNDSRPPQPAQESSTDRTRRLFYVTCSRAQESLAVIAYSANPEVVYSYILEQGWFQKNEIVLLPSGGTR